MNNAEDGSAEQIVFARAKTVLRKLCTSHLLSVWNSRMFEFGAVLFLAAIKPGTLFYASAYAIVRNSAAVLLASKIGHYVDKSNRLVSIRLSIILQRGSVAISCVLFLLCHLLRQSSEITFNILFVALAILSCMEKVGAIANTVAVERDWIPVLSESIQYERSVLNALLRRIDLTCKLLSPVAISFVQTYSTTWAIGTTLLTNLVSMFIEYFAILQVYSTVPELANKGIRGRESILLNRALDDETSTLAEPAAIKGQSQSAFKAWRAYYQSPIFFASISLCLLYLTVLSTGAQYQTYMLSLNFSPLSVSVIRVAAVSAELSATFFAPILILFIGQIRTGLWSINWQSLTLTAGVALFIWLNETPLTASYTLTAAIVLSRIGLWGFDLAVQDLVQEVSCL
jgi:solute carrier family 40 (iron-regulated transporter), member 1